MKRRNFILSGLGITGALVVGWGVLPARSRLGKPDNMLLTEGDVALNGWIKIAKDGNVVLAMHRSDMGQGIHNALSMLDEIVSVLPPCVYPPAVGSSPVVVYAVVAGPILAAAVYKATLNVLGDVGPKL
jgi:CO/xanthine dehydrogenase Mo-binding subunit